MFQFFHTFTTCIKYGLAMNQKRNIQDSLLPRVFPEYGNPMFRYYYGSSFSSTWSTWFHLLFFWAAQPLSFSLKRSSGVGGGGGGGGGIDKNQWIFNHPGLLCDRYRWSYTCYLLYPCSHFLLSYRHFHRFHMLELRLPIVLFSWHRWQVTFQT